MIEINIVQSAHALPPRQVLEIDDEIIEKVKISELPGEELDLFVWIDKTPEIFFCTKG
jgi:thermostable 8-oxoguanine DNA glycosylase